MRLTPHFQDLVDLSLTTSLFRPPSGFLRSADPQTSSDSLSRDAFTPGPDPLYSPSFNCSLSAYALCPCGSPSNLLSMRSLFADPSYCYPLARLMSYAYPPFLIPIYPTPRSCVRIICCQACTVVCEHPPSLPSSPLFLIAFPFLIPIAFRSYRSKRPPCPRPLCPSHFPPRTIPLLSLFSVLGFVWVEGVSRGHCIVYKCVYLRLARLSRDFLSLSMHPPSSHSSRFCVYWFTLGGRIYVSRRME